MAKRWARASKGKKIIHYLADDHGVSIFHLIELFKFVYLRNKLHQADFMKFIKPIITSIMNVELMAHFNAIDAKQTCFQIKPLKYLNLMIYQLYSFKNVGI